MIYFVQEGDGGPVKIGWAKNRRLVRLRYTTLQIGNPAKLTLLGVTEGDQEQEKALHRYFAADRIRGEWFRPSAEMMRAATDPGLTRYLTDFQWSRERYRNMGLGSLSERGVEYVLALERLVLDYTEFSPADLFTVRGEADAA